MEEAAVADAEEVIDIFGKSSCKPLAGNQYFSASAANTLNLNPHSPPHKLHTLKSLVVSSQPAASF